jgi:hypothetical protein
MTAFLNDSLALLSLLARNLVHIWTHEAHNCKAASISALVSIPPAAMTEICHSHISSRYARISGIEFSNLADSLYTSSKFLAQRCPQALAGASTTMASGNLHLLFQRSTRILSALKSETIGIRATSG